MASGRVVLLLCVLAAGIFGYWLGLQSQSSEQDIGYQHNVEIELHEPVHQPISASDEDTIERPTVKAPLEVVSDTVAPSDDSESPQQSLQQVANEFEYPMVREGDASYSHNQERKDFENSYSEDDADWQAKTQFTDFLQLHDNAHLIELHKIICTSDKCQLIGKIEAEHESWGEIVKQMQQQDWWTYWGTSSSTTSRDGVTYFNLFVNKPPEQP